MKKIKKNYADKSSLEIAKIISQTALDKKAEELLILDVRELSGFTDYFVIMSGRSTRHVQGLASAVDQEMSSKRLTSSNTEGMDDGLWVLLDYNDVVVQIFYSEVRSFYDLEGLWHDAPRVEFVDE
jgi:ribosome-associated protein